MSYIKFVNIIFTILIGVTILGAIMIETEGEKIKSKCEVTTLNVIDTDGNTLIVYSCPESVMK